MMHVQIWSSGIPSPYSLRTSDSEFDDYVSKLKRLMACLKDVAANIHKELGMQRVLQIYCENKDRPGNEFGTTLHGECVLQRRLRLDRALSGQHPV